MRRVAQYYYQGENGEIVINVYAEKRRVWIRDASAGVDPKDPRFPLPPFDLTFGKRNPHPVEGELNGEVVTYDEIGLYYNYRMPDTGWDGDC